MTIRDRINDFYNRFLSLSGRPEEIARAMALGVFIGVTPTIPFHTALVMVSCLIFRQNITAGMLGATIVSNPLTIPFFYLAEYELGILVLGLDPNPFALTDYDVRAILEIGLHILYPLMVGGLILACLFIVPSYFISRYAVVNLRNRYVEPSEPSP
ncbi:MAG: DUF2062 domain-containing protein [Syntrophaceae bacterium]